MRARAKLHSAKRRWISGGRTHAAHTRKVNNRLATALHMAAQSLHRSKSSLGDWFRRLKSKLGTKAAVTAAAHKLARILWAMVKHRRPYDPGRLGTPEPEKSDLFAVRPNNSASP